MKRYQTPSFYYVFHHIHGQIQGKFSFGILEKFATYLGFGLVYVMLKILLPNRPRKLIVHFMKAVPNLKFASDHIICHFAQILRKNNTNALFENANISQFSKCPS